MAVALKLWRPSAALPKKSNPANSIRRISPNRSSPNTFTLTTFQIPICSSAPAAKCASATSCSGRFPIPNSSSPKHSGPTFENRNSTSRSKNIIAADAASVPSDHVACQFNLSNLFNPVSVSLAAHGLSPTQHLRFSAPAVQSQSLCPPARQHSRTLDNRYPGALFRPPLHLRLRIHAVHCVFRRHRPDRILRPRRETQSCMLQRLGHLRRDPPDARNVPKPYRQNRNAF